MTHTGKSNGMKAVAAATAFFMMVMPAVPWNPSQNAYASALYTETRVAPAQDAPVTDEVSEESAPAPEPMMPVDVIDWTNQGSALSQADNAPEIASGAATPMVFSVASSAMNTEIASSARAIERPPTPAGVPDSGVVWEGRPGTANPSLLFLSPSYQITENEFPDFSITPPSTDCSSSGFLDPECFSSGLIDGPGVSQPVTLEKTVTGYYDSATLERVAGVSGYSREDIMAIERSVVQYANFPAYYKYKLFFKHQANTPTPKVSPSPEPEPTPEPTESPVSYPSPEPSTPEDPSGNDTIKTTQKVQYIECANFRSGSKCSAVSQDVADQYASAAAAFQKILDSGAPHMTGTTAAKSDQFYNNVTLADGELISQAEVLYNTSTDALSLDDSWPMSWSLAVNKVSSPEPKGSPEPERYDLPPVCPVAYPYSEILQEAVIDEDLGRMLNNFSFEPVSEDPESLFVSIPESELDFTVSDIPPSSESNETSTASETTATTENTTIASEPIIKESVEPVTVTNEPGTNVSSGNGQLTSLDIITSPRYFNGTSDYLVQKNLPQSVPFFPGGPLDEYMIQTRISIDGLPSSDRVAVAADGTGLGLFIIKDKDNGKFYFASAGPSGDIYDLKMPIEDKKNYLVVLSNNPFSGLHALFVHPLESFTGVFDSFVQGSPAAGSLTQIEVGNDFKGTILSLSYLYVIPAPATTPAPEPSFSPEISPWSEPSIDPSVEPSPESSVEPETITVVPVIPGARVTLGCRVSPSTKAFRCYQTQNRVVQTVAYARGSGIPENLRPLFNNNENVPQEILDDYMSRLIDSENPGRFSLDTTTIVDQEPIHNAMAIPVFGDADWWGWISTFAKSSIPLPEPSPVPSDLPSSDPSVSHWKRCPSCSPIEIIRLSDGSVEERTRTVSLSHLQVFQVAETAFALFWGDDETIYHYYPTDIESDISEGQDNAIGIREGTKFTLSNGRTVQFTSVAEDGSGVTVTLLPLLSSPSEMTPPDLAAPVVETPIPEVSLSTEESEEVNTVEPDATEDSNSNEPGTVDPTSTPLLQNVNVTGSEKKAHFTMQVLGTPGFETLSAVTPKVTVEIANGPLENLRNYAFIAGTALVSHPGAVAITVDDTNPSSFVAGQIYYYRVTLRVNEWQVAPVYGIFVMGGAPASNPAISIGTPIVIAAPSQLPTAEPAQPADPAPMQSAAPKQPVTEQVPGTPEEIDRAVIKRDVSTSEIPVNICIRTGSDSYGAPACYSSLAEVDQIFQAHVPGQTFTGLVRNPLQVLGSIADDLNSRYGAKEPLGYYPGAPYPSLESDKRHGGSLSSDDIFARAGDYNSGRWGHVLMTVPGGSWPIAPPAQTFLSHPVSGREPLQVFTYTTVDIDGPHAFLLALYDQAISVPIYPATHLFTRDEIGNAAENPIIETPTPDPSVSIAPRCPLCKTEIISLSNENPTGTVGYDKIRFFQVGGEVLGVFPSDDGTNTFQYFFPNRATGNNSVFTGIEIEQGETIISVGGHDVQFTSYDDGVAVKLLSSLSSPPEMTPPDLPAPVVETRIPEVSSSTEESEEVNFIDESEDTDGPQSGDGSNVMAAGYPPPGDGTFDPSTGMLMPTIYSKVEPNTTEDSNPTEPDTSNADVDVSDLGRAIAGGSLNSGGLGSSVVFEGKIYQNGAVLTLAGKVREGYVPGVHQIFLELNTIGENYYNSRQSPPLTENNLVARKSAKVSAGSFKVSDTLEPGTYHVQMTYRTAGSPQGGIGQFVKVEGTLEEQEKVPGTDPPESTTTPTSYLDARSAVAVLEKVDAEKISIERLLPMPMDCPAGGCPVSNEVYYTVRHDDGIYHYSMMALIHNPDGTFSLSNAATSKFISKEPLELTPEPSKKKSVPVTLSARAPILQIREMSLDRAFLPFAKEFKIGLNDDGLGHIKVLGPYFTGNLHYNTASRVIEDGMLTIDDVSVAKKFLGLDTDISLIGRAPEDLARARAALDFAQAQAPSMAPSVQLGAFIQFISARKNAIIPAPSLPPANSPTVLNYQAAGNVQGQTVASEPGAIRTGTEATQDLASDNVSAMDNSASKSETNGHDPLARTQDLISAVSENEDVATGVEDMPGTDSATVDGTDVINRGGSAVMAEGSTPPSQPGAEFPDPNGNIIPIIHYATAGNANTEVPANTANAPKMTEEEIAAGLGAELANVEGAENFLQPLAAQFLEEHNPGDAALFGDGRLAARQSAIASVRAARESARSTRSSRGFFGDGDEDDFDEIPPSDEEISLIDQTLGGFEDFATPEMVFSLVNAASKVAQKFSDKDSRISLPVIFSTAEAAAQFLKDAAKELFYEVGLLLTNVMGSIAGLFFTSFDEHEISLNHETTKSLGELKSSGRKDVVLSHTHPAKAEAILSRTDKDTDKKYPGWLSIVASKGGEFSKDGNSYADENTFTLATAAKWIGDKLFGPAETDVIKRGDNTMMVEGFSPPFTPAGPPNENGISMPIIYATAENANTGVSANATPDSYASGETNPRLLGSLETALPGLVRGEGVFGDGPVGQQNTPPVEYGASAARNTSPAEYGASAARNTPSVGYGASGRNTPSVGYGASEWNTSPGYVTSERSTPPVEARQVQNTPAEASRQGVSLPRLATPSDWSNYIQTSAAAQRGDIIAELRSIRDPIFLQTILSQLDPGVDIDVVNAINEQLSALRGEQLILSSDDGTVRNREPVIRVPRTRDTSGTVGRRSAPSASGRATRTRSASSNPERTARQTASAPSERGGGRG